MGGNLAVSAVHGFSDRPPMAFGGTNRVLANPLPPDDLWYVRLADWLPAPKTQPRCGASRPADGGTIFFDDLNFESLDAFAAELQSDARLGLPAIDPEPRSEQRVVLWMREGDTTLRAVVRGENSPAKNTTLIPEWVGSPEEFPLPKGFLSARELRERSDASEAAASPLAVWTLWTSPLHQ